MTSINVISFDFHQSLLDGLAIFFSGLEYITYGVFGIAFCQDTRLRDFDTVYFASWLSTNDKP